MSYAKFIMCAAAGVAVLFFFSWVSFAIEEQAVIIGVKTADGISAQGVLQALGAQVSEQGGRIEHTYTLIRAVAALLTKRALQEVEQNPNVRYIVPDGLVATPERWAVDSVLQPAAPELLGAATPVELYTWGVERVKAPVVHRAEFPHSTSSSPRSLWALGALLALGLVGSLGLGAVKRSSQRILYLVPWMLGIATLLGGCSWVVVLPHAGILGEGVEVALLDTGIDFHHPDLRDNFLGGVDLVNSDDEPQDDNGHGTGVAGILAAEENGQGLIGVAPRAKIWSVKILDRDEQGAISDLIEGLEWAVEHGAQVISMSLGTPEDNPALQEAVQAAQRAGKLLIAASGNKGTRVLFPAAYPEVIAVAATDRGDRRAWFSNMGPEVELAAPGMELLSTAPEGKYQIVNGTSFSVPHVAGVAALLFSIGLTDPEAVRHRLDQTADDLGLLLAAQGYGLVDAERAVLGSR